MMHAENTFSETNKYVGNGNHAAAIEQAALYMVETLPRMFKTVKQRLRSADPGCRELGDSQMWTLRMLAEGKQVTSELAHHFNVTTPTMTRIVDGLVNKGLVERRHDPEDRRRIYLEVTAKGTESAKKAHEQFRATLADYLSPLSSEQLADIMRAFAHLKSLLPDDTVEHGER
ncbi:MAG: MarR family transcriptional regulator [Chloroflexia bacterium]